MSTLDFKWCNLKSINFSSFNKLKLTFYSKKWLKLEYSRKYLTNQIKSENPSSVQLYQHCFVQITHIIK